MAYTEKYVSVAGAGAHDGTSEANAWTLAEAVADGTNNTRRNVKSGTYTLAANLAFPVGLSEQTILWRGYNTVIGDLDDAGRDSATGELDDSNFPIIDGGATPYTISLANFNAYRFLTFKSAGDAATVIGALNCAVPYRCKFINTHATGASATCYGGVISYTQFVDCDFTIASTSASARVLELSNRDHCDGCRIWSTGATPAGVGVYHSSLNQALTRCIIFDVVRAIECQYGGLISRCTIFDVTTGVYLSAPSRPVSVVECIIYDCSGYVFDGDTAASPLLLRNAARGGLGSGRINTGTIGTTIEEIDPVLLTADPFTASGSNDFTLNDTAGGGALCRAASGMWGGFDDLGAVQHEDSGGSTVHTRDLARHGV